MRLTEGARMKLAKFLVLMMTAQVVLPGLLMAQSQREMKFQELRREYVYRSQNDFV